MAKLGVRIRGSIRSLCPLGAAAILSAAASACTSHIAGPPVGPNTAEGYVEVPFDPPAGRAEAVPPRPRGDMVWIDGQWNWDGVRYRWVKGAWTVPPPNAYFARWEVTRRADGVLLFAPAVWRDKTTGQVLGGPGEVEAPDEEHK